MRRMKRLAIIAASAPLVLLAACDGEEPTNPGGTTEGAPPSESVGAPNPAVKAPSVQNPLDAGPFAANPCTSLTDAQRGEFTLGPGEPDEDPSQQGQGCKWDNDDAQLAVFVTYHPELTTGLSHLYEQNDAGYWKHWKPTELDGYPAVFAMTEEPGADCTLSVGISDTLYFYVNVMAEAGDGCVAAENVASAVLATIKAGGA